MKSKKTQPKAAPARPAIAEKVDAIIRLIDHAKRQGVAYFRSPEVGEFGFRREDKPIKQGPREEGDGFIP